MPAPLEDLHRSPFGHWLTSSLRTRNMTQEDLSDRLGIKQGTVSHWCVGRVPRAHNCIQIATVLGLPPADVLMAAGHLADLSDYDATEPTRARFHALIDIADPAILEPHLAILERTVALMQPERK